MDTNAYARATEVLAEIGVGDEVKEFEGTGRAWVESRQIWVPPDRSKGRKKGEGHRLWTRVQGGRDRNCTIFEAELVVSVLLAQGRKCRPRVPDLQAVA